MFFSVQGEFQSSIFDIDRAIKLKPDEVIYIANKGIILARQGYYIEALKCCELAVSQNPNHESSYYARACYFALQNDEIQALENLGKAIEISPHISRREAKKNPDFDRMRDNTQFKALIEGTQVT